jgi:hypothetical protein
MLSLVAKSFNRQLQLSVNLSAKEVYLFHVFLTSTITRWNLKWIYPSIQIYTDVLRSILFTLGHIYFILSKRVTVIK